MLADFLTVIPHRASMVLITSRPEYEGALTRVHGAQTIALAPLADSDTAALIGELLGSDPSVGELAAVIAESPANRPADRWPICGTLFQRRVNESRLVSVLGLIPARRTTAPFSGSRVSKPDTKHSGLAGRREVSGPGGSPPCIRLSR